MSLTHVEYRDENGNWRPITVQEAYRKYRYTVGCDSRRFRCRLCKEDVTFVNCGGTPFFRHRPGSYIQCDDKMIGYGLGEYSTTSNITKIQETYYSLPLILKVNSTKSFQLLIAFFPLMDDKTWRGIGSFQVIIRQISQYRPFVYDKERFSPYTTTYLNVGETPSTEYHLEYNLPPESYAFGWNYSHRLNELQKFWPTRVEGVQVLGDDYHDKVAQDDIEKGAFFEKVNGKKVPVGGDLYLNKEYYVLTNTNIDFIQSNEWIRSTKVCEKNNWSVYRVQLLEQNAIVDELVQRFHYHIGSTVIDSYPIFPICVAYPHTYRHNSTWDHLYFATRGRAIADGSHRCYNIPVDDISNSYKFIFVDSSGDAERKDVYLGLSTEECVQYYTYVYKDAKLFNSLSYSGHRIIVRDIEDKTINQGLHITRPKRNSLIISPLYNGLARVTYHGVETSRHVLKANTDTFINDVRFGDTIEVYYGKDLVWKASFCRKEGQKDDVSKELVRKFNADEEQVSISHNLGSVLSTIVLDKKAISWLRKRIREGSINAESLKSIIRLIKQIRNNKKSNK